MQPALMVLREISVQSDRKVHLAIKALLAQPEVLVQKATLVQQELLVQKVTLVQLGLKEILVPSDRKVLKVFRVFKDPLALKVRQEPPALQVLPQVQ